METKPSTLGHTTTSKEMSDSSATSKTQGVLSALQNPRKRERASDDASFEEPTPEEFSRMTRSERKRHREKKRRNDVNKGFDELLGLLIEIDPDVRADVEEKSRRGQGKAYGSGGHDENILSRVDLISRTIDVMRRLQRENEEKSKVISNLLDARSGANGGITANALVAAAHTNTAPAVPRTLERIEEPPKAYREEASSVNCRQPVINAAQLQLHGNLATSRLPSSTSAIPSLSTTQQANLLGSSSGLPSLTIAQRLSALSQARQTHLDPAALLHQHVSQPSTFLQEAIGLAGRQNNERPGGLTRRSDLLLQNMLQEPAAAPPSQLLQLVQQQDAARRLLENQLRNSGNGPHGSFPNR